jgi:hypothetical protein
MEHLVGQAKAVYDVLKDGRRHSVEEAHALNMSEASFAASVRNMRKAIYGGYIVHACSCNGTTYYYMQLDALGIPAKQPAGEFVPMDCESKRLMRLPKSVLVARILELQS